MTDFTPTFRRTTYPKISPTSNSQAGKTILVTGSSEGIGFNIAGAFAEANAATVILASRSQAKLDAAAAEVSKRHPNTNIVSRACNVASIAAVQDLWTWLAEQQLTVDVLVLNAGATEQPKSTEQMVGNLQFAVASNIIMAEAFRAQPNDAAAHRILVNISSAGIHCYPGMATQTMYHVGKAGFAAYISHVTDAIPETEMRMVNLHPGCVFTGAVERNSGGNDKIGQLPIWDDPSLSAHMAVWVAGLEAAFLHGRFIWANWDVEELLRMKQNIVEDPAMLKIGFIGIGPFSLPKLMQKCSELALEKEP